MNILINTITEYQRIPFADRKRTIDAIIKKYPNSLPFFIVSKYVSKNKHIIPKLMTIQNLLYVFKQKHKDLNENKALFIFEATSNSLLTGSMLISHIYNSYKSDDGMCFLIIQEENTFGYSLPDPL